jgi:hypothetical protein
MMEEGECDGGVAKWEECVRSKVLDKSGAIAIRCTLFRRTEPDDDCDRRATNNGGKKVEEDIVSGKSESARGEQYEG